MLSTISSPSHRGRAKGHPWHDQARRCRYDASRTLTGSPWKFTVDHPFQNVTHETIEATLGRVDTLTERGFTRESATRGRRYTDNRGFTVDAYPAGARESVVKSASPCAAADDSGRDIILGAEQQRRTVTALALSAWDSGDKASLSAITCGALNTQLPPTTYESDVAFRERPPARTLPLAAQADW
ncbi:hypothetical protein [Nocardia puris]|uniref:Uncharacterized protein n=2 Tax=Nocardia puris TaxID=208602 RepID=A0A366CZ22_9NOCA|nr:hypothetical protein [Nocardia puris]RBO83090.1 hypothetical protein DFR74_11912 [Nocardia puris]